KFDKEHGLHSMATLLGAEKALLLAKLTHVVTLAVFFYLGQLFGLGYLYYIGVGIAGGTLYYQHKIIDVRGFRAFTRRYYVHNGIVSVAIFICTLLDVLLHG
ncbi:MAG: 4-hydroxybenzoate octaprenyltransferase, partial [Selenomonadaceae bacterium]|nr:4-hydroxybenzoate octaprenyltransferase [Selenomonadaceae bacterium]